MSDGGRSDEVGDADPGDGEADGDEGNDEATGDAAGNGEATSGGGHSEAWDSSDVPSGPEAVTDDEHVLPLEDLQYPTLVMETGTVGDDGSVRGECELDREAMAAWLEDLVGGLASHDVAVEAPDGRVTLGVAPEGADVSFDPGEDGVGDLAVTFRLRAKAMVVNDAGDPKVGARGGKGFVPLAMLTDDADPAEYRCYNWLDGPTDE